MGSKIFYKKNIVPSDLVMKNMNFIYKALLFFFIAASATGCGSSGVVSDGGGSSSSGKLSISVTDAPVDNASHVVVEFTGVTLQPETGGRLEFDFDPNDPPRQIDLLALNGGGSETILDGVRVPAGRYDWIRLKVNAECDTMDSYIEIPGDINSPYSLYVPSGSESGLKLNHGFDMPAGGSASFTIDFDLRRSVNNPQGQGRCSGNYKLKPVLRIVDNTDVGSISGSVAAGFIEDASCTGDNSVYVFEGGDVTPDDVDGIAPDPVTTAIVSFNDARQEYVYKAAFLSPGSYTIAFTCQAGNDDPERDESATANPIVFTGTDNASVAAGTETIHNFN